MKNSELQNFYKTFCKTVVPVLCAIMFLAVGIRILLALHNNRMNVYCRPDLTPIYSDNGEPDVYDSSLLFHTQEGMDAWTEALYSVGLSSPFSIVYLVDWDGRPIPKSLWVTLPADIHYYTMENGEYVLEDVRKAGTEVTIFPFETLIPGCTVTSLPTRDPGWRYLWRSSDGTSNSEGFYYVPLKDLYPLAEHLVEVEREFLYAVLDEDGRVDSTTTDEQLARILLFYVDSELYKYGVYCSPDFYHPYFDATNIVLLSAAGVLLTLHIVLRVRKAKESL